MEKIKLEGEFGNEVKLQLEQIDALNSTIREISLAAGALRKRMWACVKKEMPNISDNCTLTIENNDVILTDRLK